MGQRAGEFGVVRTERPPYEVLSTKWLSYGDVLKIKGIEEMVEVYYNSWQFALFAGKEFRAEMFHFQ